MAQGPLGLHSDRAAPSSYNHAVPGTNQDKSAEATPTVPPAGLSDGTIYLPLCAVFRRYLKGQGLKFTQERAQILDTVLEKEGVFEAEALLREIQDAGHAVSKATIYRTLKHLLEAGIISEVLIDSRHAHYRLTYGSDPRGHLVCVESETIIEFQTPELAALRDRLCAEHGFDPISIRMVIYGVSPEAKEEAGSDEATKAPRHEGGKEES